jgi:integrase
MSALEGVDGLGALALRFAILTAARSGEVRGATWAEIDMDAAVWTIPAARMKARRAHRVPLNTEALNVLALARPCRATDHGLVFPSSKIGRPLSDMTLAAVIKRLNKNKEGRPTWVDDAGVPVVPHGFRSSFRDWCADERPEPSQVVEMALAHAIQNATEAAYRRGDLFERRITLMDGWGDFCGGKVPANVSKMRRGRTITNFS